MARRPTNTTTLEDMVDRTDELDGEDYGGTGVEDNDDGDDNDESDAGDETSEDEAGEDDSSDTGDTGDDDRSTGDGRRASVDSDDATGRLTPYRDGTFLDAKGNIVDQRGQVIARAGPERRLFERNQRAENVVRDLTGRLEKNNEQIRAWDEVLKVPRELGLDSEDLRTGYPIIAEFKKDPVSAVRKLLEMTLGMGHTLDQVLGQQGVGGLDTAAISRMLDERLRPIVQERQQSERVRQQEQESQQAVERFFDEHEYSRVHANAINDLIGKRPELSPTKAYYEIRRFADINGLDFTIPLAPQVTAMQRGNGASTGNRQQTRQRNAPLPNGRVTRGQRPIEQGEYAEPTSDWSSIIRRALNE